MCDKKWTINAGFVIDAEDAVDIVFDSFEDQFISYLVDNSFEHYPDQFENSEDEDEFHDSFFSLDDPDRLSLISYFFEDEYNIDTEALGLNMFIGIKMPTDFVDFHISFDEVSDHIMDVLGLDLIDYKFVVYGAEDIEDIE